MKKFLLIISTLLLLILISSLVMARIVPIKMGDSDGGIVYDVKGTCVDGDLDFYTDYCTGNTLTEYYIPQGEDICAVRTYNCNYCQYGECTNPPITDTDANFYGVGYENPVVAGTCTDTISSHSDYCSGTTIVEFYPGSSYCSSQAFYCDDCSLGKCNNAVDFDMALDGSNNIAYQKATASKCIDTNGLVFTDYCANSDTLIEYTLSSIGTCESTTIETLSWENCADGRIYTPQS